METVERKRASRLSRDPVYNHLGEVKSVTPTDKDFQSFLICYEHYATVAHLAAFTGRFINHQRTRARELKRQNPQYIDIRSQHRAEPLRFKNDWQRFELRTHGLTALGEAGYELPLKFPRSSSFNHDVMADDGLMSFKYGVQQNRLMQLIGPAQILEHLPPKTKNDDKWYYFPINAPHTKWKTINADYFPLGVIRPFDDDGKWPFVVFEFETGANNRRSTQDTSTVEHKLRCWLDVVSEDKGDPTYYTHLKLPYLYVALVFRHQKDADGCLQLIKELIPKRYQHHFLVKLFKPLGPHDNPGFDGYMLETDFQRTTTLFNFLSSRLD